MVIVYKKFKKYNEIQLTKNKMDFNNRKITNHPHSPVKKQNGLIISEKWQTIHPLPMYYFKKYGKIIVLVLFSHLGHQDFAKYGPVLIHSMRKRHGEKGEWKSN